jgi:exopolyphosphatase/pppGpp-phosphohydrolase
MFSALRAHWVPINSTKWARRSCKLHRAAGVAEENSRQALESAQKAFAQAARRLVLTSGTMTGAAAMRGQMLCYSSNKSHQAILTKTRVVLFQQQLHQGILSQ